MCARVQGRYPLRLLLCMASPQDEHGRFPPCGNGSHKSIGYGFPATPRMRGWLAVFHGKAGVEQQDTLPCPGFQIAVSGWGEAQVGLQLLVYVEK